jgi:hypothetical protein
MNTEPQGRQSIQPRAAGGELLYLFSIVEPDTEVYRLLERGAVPGMTPEAPCFPIQEAGLVAAVSHVPAEIFAEGPLNTLLRDLAAVAPYALRHETVVRTLMAAAPALVPVAFGAVYQGAAGVHALLRERADAFRRALDRVRDREEWTITVFRDQAALLRAAEETNEEARALAAAVATATPGRAYLLRRQREQVVAAAAERLAAHLVGECVQRLAAVSAAVRHEAAREPSTDLLLKASFLVPRAAVVRFTAEAERLRAAAASHGLRLTVSGPWAPYSFAEEFGDEA